MYNYTEAVHKAAADVLFNPSVYSRWDTSGILRDHVDGLVDRTRAKLGHEGVLALLGYAAERMLRQNKATMTALQECVRDTELVIVDSSGVQMERTHADFKPLYYVRVPLTYEDKHIGAVRLRVLPESSIKVSLDTVIQEESEPMYTTLQQVVSYIINLS